MDIGRSWLVSVEFASYLAEVTRFSARVRRTSGIFCQTSLAQLRPNLGDRRAAERAYSGSLLGAYTRNPAQPHARGMAGEEGGPPPATLGAAGDEIPGFFANYGVTDAGARARVRGGCATGCGSAPGGVEVGRPRARAGLGSGTRRLRRRLTEASLW